MVGWTVEVKPLQAPAVGFERGVLAQVLDCIGMLYTSRTALGKLKMRVVPKEKVTTKREIGR